MFATMSVVPLSTIKPQRVHNASPALSRASTNEPKTTPDATLAASSGHSPESGEVALSATKNRSNPTPDH
jgi:hypothetical protein